jgi:predicted nucleic acid-binding protein
VSDEADTGRRRGIAGAIRRRGKPDRRLDLSASVVDRATDLRAKYSFKAPDALHLATAIDGGSMAFWTGDAALARCLEIPVVVLSGPP